MLGYKFTKDQIETMWDNEINFNFWDYMDFIDPPEMIECVFEDESELDKAKNLFGI